MRFSRGWVAVVLVAALMAAGCSDDTGGSSGSSGPSAAASEGSTQAAAPSADPTPTRYTARQLGAALPQGRKQLHGVTKLATECRDLSKGCNDVRGWGLVDANADPVSVRLLVSVLQTHDPAAYREQWRGCADGRFDHPLEWNKKHTSYSIGERGVARRTAFDIGEWRGFVCQKTGVHLFSDGPSERHTWQMAVLTNGIHGLTTSALTMGMTKALAREYLARLTVGAGLGSG